LASRDSLLHYEVHGDRGPHLLLVHGMLSSRAQWLLNLEAFSNFCRPVIVELFGHGRSPTPHDPAAYSPAAYIAEFETIRSHLQADRWYVCGQSLGAALTLRYSLDHPDRVVAQVFTNSNSALAGHDWAQRVLPLMEAQSRQLERDGHAALENHPLRPGRGRRLPPEARAALTADYALHNPLGIARSGLYTVPYSSVRARIAANTVSVLLVAGDREEGFRDARSFAEQSIPHLSVVRLDAGHAVNLEAAPAFNAAVSEFFRRFV